MGYSPESSLVVVYILGYESIEYNFDIYLPAGMVGFLTGMAADVSGPIRTALVR